MDLQPCRENLRCCSVNLLGMFNEVPLCRTGSDLLRGSGTTAACQDVRLSSIWHESFFFLGLATLELPKRDIHVPPSLCFEVTV